MTGFCIVKGNSLDEAAQASRELGINTEDEIDGFAVPLDRIGSIPIMMRERLLSKNALESWAKSTPPN